MKIPNELEGLECPDKTPEADGPQPKGKQKPQPSRTPEELAAAIAYVQSVRNECAAREALRATEREAARLAAHTGKLRPGGQVYWSTSGRMLCAKCHRYCDQNSVGDSARCMGHSAPVDHAVLAKIRESRLEWAQLMRDEEQRRRATRVAGRNAARAEAKRKAWR